MGLLTSQTSRRLDFKTEQIGFVFPVRISNQTFQAANLALSFLFQQEMLFIFSLNPRSWQTEEVLSVKITKSYFLNNQEEDFNKILSELV